ncbi:MAG: DUF3793 family protein [Lachnospiraceae bacterium]|nr:DUF3793 family protein [Lachnospiraceae bacterium]
MIKHALVDYCAPTLAGIKTGNVFSVRNGLTDIDEEIRRLNGILVDKGLRLVPIRKNKKSTLIYLYRPDRLKEDLNNPDAAQILEEKGYPCGNPDCCLVELVKHLKSDESFPHEIGLFLGYPPSDVKCFMEDPCKGVKCVGCWKAYSNEREAKKTFERYHHCTEIYIKENNKGKPLEALIVDTRSAVRVAINNNHPERRIINE